MHKIAHAGSMDIEYAKNLAISRQKNYSIVFNVTGDTYKIQDKDSRTINHPITGKLYSVSFANDSRLSRVEIISVDFNDSDVLTFDYLGSPLDEESGPLNLGEIILDADGYRMKISVQAVTGYLTIN